jgi:hypothetical protein
MLIQRPNSVNTTPGHCSGPCQHQSTFWSQPQTALSSSSAQFYLPPFYSTGVNSSAHYFLVSLHFPKLFPREASLHICLSPCIQEHGRPSCTHQTWGCRAQGGCCWGSGCCWSSHCCHSCSYCFSLQQTQSWSPCWGWLQNGKHTRSLSRVVWVP